MRRSCELGIVLVGMLGLARAAAGAAATASEAFKQYQDALVKAKTIDEVLPHLAKARRSEIDKTPADEKEGAFAALKASADRVELTVTQETPAGGGATLTLKAVTGLGDDETGTVQLVKEDGAFKIAKEDWSSKLGPKPARPCDQLATEIKSTTAATRARAAAVLGNRFGTPCPLALPALLDALGDASPGIRQNAGSGIAANLTSLKNTSPESVAKYQDQLPRLTAARETARKADEVFLEISLQDAVTAFGAPALPLLVKDLNHTNRSLRWGAAANLERLGPAAASVLPAVRKAAQAEKDGGVKEKLADAEKALAGK